MSSVSPIGGSGGSSSIDSAQFARGNPAKQFDKDLTKFLESKSVSSDEQTSIKEDLKKSLTESFQSGGQPDPSKISNSIKTVLDKHGVDGGEFTKSLPNPTGGRHVGASGPPGAPPTGGPPPGGPPPGAKDVSGKDKAQGSSQTDYLQSLLDQLDESIKKQREDASQKADKNTSTQKSTTTNTNLNRSGGNLDVQV